MGNANVHNARKGLLSASKKAQPKKKITQFAESARKRAAKGKKGRK